MKNFVTAVGAALCLLAALLVSLLLSLPAQGQNSAQQKQGKGQAKQNLANAEIHVLPVQGTVYMLVGPGGNVTVQVGKEGVLVVDTMFAELSEKLLTEIRKLSNGPIRYVLNTHAHPDHTGGNEKISAA